MRFLAILLILAGCTHGQQVKTTSPVAEPLFEGMGKHQRPVTSPVPLAQKYFDQGLVWVFAFNHDEAIRSFQQAILLDPQMAMAWWGIALSHGPHINNPVMTIERSAAAWEALEKARDLKINATPVEQALIGALGKRYAKTPPENRQTLDQAYAAEMRRVWKKYPNDGDVGVLFAEALMDLRPWDLWAHDGKPQPETSEILAVLEKVLRLNPDHPGALHLYIHAVEASPQPERAIAKANRLRQLVPASGHLVHMPSHIDVLTGQWVKASQANVQAIDADRGYRKKSPKQDFYHIYMVHNHQMLGFAAMMQGQCQVALQAARDMVMGVPKDYAKNHAALIDGVMALPYETLMRFGQWDEILREPAPPKYFPISTALWRFSRAVALAAKAQMAAAEKEKTRFHQAVAAVPPEAMMAINPAKKILAIATQVLEGEIAYRKGDIAAAEAALREGIRLEDTLQYMEPPEWIQPVRQTLGAILVSTGRYDEAEDLYREDLEKWPENGWSLFGLSQSLRGRGNTAEADRISERFKTVWSNSDTPIDSSCLCVSSAQTAKN